MHSCLLWWITYSGSLVSVAPYNHQSLQAEHGIKSLSSILTKHLTEQGQMWHKYLPLATLACNTFNSPNLGNYLPYELVFGRKPTLLLDLETDPDIKISGTYREYYTLLGKRLQYLHKLLQNFRMKRLALIKKDRDFFQYNSEDLVYIISPLTSQLRTAFRKVTIKFVGLLNCRPSQLFIDYIRWKVIERTIWTWKTKASCYKNK